MPDLTIEYHHHCESCDHWQKNISGSNGNQYIVRWNDSDHLRQHETTHEYSCTCPAYKFGGGKWCKHIKTARLEHCAWNSIHNTDGFRDPVEDETGEKLCPRCGASTFVLGHGV